MKSSQADHRVRITRMMIRRAFLTLLEQRPIQSITVKALCEEAGVNRGTFYAHYQDIYSLLEQLEREMVAELTVALSPILEAPDSEHFLVQICTGIFECLQANADLCKAMLGPHGDAHFVTELLQLGKQTCLTAYAQYFRSASPRMFEYYYAFVSEGCIGLIRQWLHEGMTGSAREIAEMAEGIMLQGIAFLDGQGQEAGL